MSDLPAVGSLLHPVRLDPYQRIISVHWNPGRFGILEITHPDGVEFNFGAYSVGGSLTGDFTKENVDTTIMRLSLSDPPRPLLYHIDDFIYLIGTVVFPDRKPPDPFAYETIRASIHSPNRFVEVEDLRTLSEKEFPFGIGGWPTDGNWSDPAFAWGTWADGRPGYLPASSGPDPAAPGYYINPNWGLGEAYEPSTEERSATKSAWILDFRKSADGEDRIGNGTVELSIRGPSHDKNLSSYTMAIELRMFAVSGRYTVGATTVTALRPAPSSDPLPAIRTQSTSASYDQSGVIARITKAGFSA